MLALMPSVPQKSYDALAVANGHGTPYALLAVAQQVTWQTSFDSGVVTAINIIIETSLDNSNWNTVATTTDTAGEIGTFTTSALFIRASIVSHTGSYNVTVNIVTKPGILGGVNSLSNNEEVLFNDNGVIGGNQFFTYNKSLKLLTVNFDASNSYQSQLGAAILNLLEFDGFSAGINFFQGHSGSPTSPVASVDGDGLGANLFVGTNTTPTQFTAASIEAKVSGTVDTSVPSSIEFKTTAVSGALALAFKIRNDGGVEITGIAEIGTFTFANLPVPSAGMLAYITDSDTVTWGANIGGGNTNKVLAWYNGSHWTVIGK